MKVKVIVGRMSLKQKIRLCTGLNHWQTVPMRELGVPALIMSDGTNGVRFQKGSTGEIQTEEKQELNLYDAMLNSGFDSDDALGNTYEATCFPTGAALACSWDTALAEEIGGAVARECKRIGIGLLLGPGMNIRRHPLTARNFEYYSEDPVLSGDLAAATVRGIQSEGIGATLKHFVCNNSDTRRTRLNCIVEERALREIYLAGFERAIKKANPAAVMGSYPAINGIQACQNKWLLTDVLRNDWGFKGLVISDWGAVKDSAEAATAGLDLQMPWSRQYVDQVSAALEDGSLTEADVDLHCERLLNLIFQYSREGKEQPDVDWDSHHALAQKAAAECGVLLRNEGNILPLAKNKKQTIAVLGGIAKTPLYQGTGCAIVNAKKVDIPFEELKKAAPEITWLYSEGYRSDYTTGAELLEEAVKTAKSADAAVILVGSRLPQESDDFDRQNMDLEESHAALIEAVCAVQPNTIVVVCNGEAVSMPWIRNTRAVLDMWYAGEGGGKAMADLLVGNVNPGGKLAVSIPVKLSDTPAYLDFPHEQDTDRYREGIFAGYRYYDTREIEPLFPFGYGLSYTRFRYDSIDVKPLPQDEYEVTVLLTNTGSYTGSEVVQLYVSPKSPRVFRPVKELKGFVKLNLDPGKSACAVFALTRRDFAYFDDRLGSWRTDEGVYCLMAGSSSRDLPLVKNLHIVGDDVPRQSLSADSHYTDLFQYPQAAKVYFDFLTEKGLLRPEQAGGELEQELKKTFWGFSQHLDMITSGALTQDMLEDLLRRMNAAIQ
jgi:beta-glucosidase